MTRWLTLPVAIVLISTALLAQDTRQATVTLKAAIAAETVERDLTKAISLYERALKEAGSDRALVTDIQSHLNQARTRQLAQSGPVAGRGASVNATRNGQTAEPFEATRALDFMDPRPASADYLSPSGKYVLRANEDRDGYRVVMRDIASGLEKELFKTASGYQARWSPDGSRVAIVTEDRIEGILRRELRMATATSGETRLVTSVPSTAGTRGAWSAPVWSPDSQRLVFSFADGGPSKSPSAVFVAAVDSVPLQRVQPDAVSPANFLWSPDGTRLVFRATGGGTGTERFVAVTLGTGTLTGIATPPLPSGAREGCPGGPGAREVVCTRLDQWGSPATITGTRRAPIDGVPVAQVFLSSPDGAPARVICGQVAADADRCVDSKFDGRGVIVRDPATRRYAYRNANTQTEQPLTTGSGEEDWFVRSPDGRLAAFGSSRDGRWGLYIVALDQIPSSRPLRIATLDRSPSRTFNIDWLANGLLYLAFGVKDSTLHRIDVDGQTGRPTSPPVQLNTDSSEKDHPMVSPDGRRIVAWTVRGLTTGVAVMGVSGAGDRMVAAHPMIDTVGLIEGKWGVPLAWRSPTEVLYYDWRGEPGLGLIDLEKGTVSRVEHGAGIARAAQGALFYSPSTKEIVFPSRSQLRYEGEIVARSLVDGRERTIARGMSLTSVAVSSTGQVAYSLASDPAKGVPGQLRLTSLTGGPETVLQSSETASSWALSARAWSPDSRFLVYRDLGERLSVLSIASRESWPLLPPDSGGWDEAVWSPDGSFIVVRRYQFRDEWHAYTGVTTDAVMKLIRKGP